MEEEADETLYWFEILVESGLAPSARIALLITEANELLAMTVASIKTLRSRLSHPANNRQSSIVNRQS